MRNHLTIFIFFVIFLYTVTIFNQSPILYQVSKTKSLGKYRPKNLKKFDNVLVCNCIIKDLQNLIDHAKKDGITLKVISGYRSYAKQVALFKNYIKQEQKKDHKISKKEAIKRANRYSALPGHSEHQLGTTVDILSSENNYQFSSDRKLKYINWLKQNAYKYNFKISYPINNKEYIYEPWHIRWWPNSL